MTEFSACNFMFKKSHLHNWIEMLSNWKTLKSFKRGRMEKYDKTWKNRAKFRPNKGRVYFDSDVSGSPIWSNTKLNQLFLQGNYLQVQESETSWLKVRLNGGNERERGLNYWLIQGRRDSECWWWDVLCVREHLHIGHKDL